MAALQAGLIQRGVTTVLQVGVAGGIVLVAVLWSEVRSRLLADPFHDR